MTTNQIVSTIRRKILEKTDENVKSNVILEYCNEAYKDVFKALYSSNGVKTETVACSNGVCVLPVRYGRFYSPAKDNRKREYEEFSIADFESLSEPQGFTVKDGRLLVSDKDIGELTVNYFEEPEELSASVDPSIEPYFHELIVYGGCWRCFEDLQDEENVELYRNKFNTMLVEKTSKQSSYEEGNQSGGQLFEPQVLVS